MKTISQEEAVKELDALMGADSEKDHGLADDILLMRLRALGDQAVVDAYERAQERLGFWYA